MAILEDGLEDHIVNLLHRKQAVALADRNAARVDVDGVGVQRQGHRLVEALGHFRRLHRVVAVGVGALEGKGRLRQGHDARCCLMFWAKGTEV